MKQTFYPLTILSFLIFLFLTLSNKPFLQIEKVKQESPSIIKDENLLSEIRLKASQYNEEPDDAYIDRVWKKTPGRNGLRVNIDKTYEQMIKFSEFDESLLVYDEVSPKVSLNDLPPSTIYRGHPDKDMVALMINVSWGSEHIPAILEILKEHRVKATFFIEGKWAKENKQLLEMIDEEGHLIGNHAYNHPDMAKVSKRDAYEQIERTNNIIEAILNKRPTYFAPPSGSFNDSVVEIATDLKMETILWTVDTIDWQNPSVSVMINRVMTNIHPGATILMHPTEPVVQGLSSLITQIKDEQYRIGTVEQLLSEQR